MGDDVRRHQREADPEADKDADLRQWKCLVVLRAGGVKAVWDRWDSDFQSCGLSAINRSAAGVGATMISSIYAQRI